MFRVGDPVRYLNDMGADIGRGHVSSTTDLWVIASFDDGVMTGDVRAFARDGSVPPRGAPPETSCGVRVANARGGRLENLSQDTGRIVSIQEEIMSNEHPPEPKIGYGVFDNISRVVQPGYSGNTQIGYGIFDLPRSAPGLVVTSADDVLLQEYLRTAQTAWRNDCLAVDFNKIENRLEFLLGLELTWSWVYADQFGSEVRFPVDVDPRRRKHQLVFDYTTDNLVTGLMSREQVQDHLNNHSPIVTAVEGDKITLSTGSVFHMTSRYRENQQPTMHPATDVKALLMQNLVMQRAARDSAEAEPVEEPVREMEPA